jgi:DNA invertase Pin-like site-specific DNA recombinase
MAEVQSGSADFSAILVYDVSRWGRFQDADEGAYHEHVCSRAGIRVHYCGEQFENDGSIGSNLLKTVKRVMAGEYSRELSVKVFAGQCRLVELGFRQGGAPGYGLRRVLIDEHRTAKGELARGDRKSLQTDRVVLVLGPSEEVDVVRRMYRMFVEDGRSEREIADALNDNGLLTDLGRPWTRASVHQVLTNEKYIGNNVYNKVSFKLKQKRVVNAREMWIRAEGAYPSIVDRALFAKEHARSSTRAPATIPMTSFFPSSACCWNSRACSQASSSTSAMKCRRRASIAIASEACCELMNSSGMNPIATIATSRSTALFANCIPVSCPNGESKTSGAMVPGKSL